MNVNEIEHAICFTGHRTHKLGVRYNTIEGNKTITWLESSIRQVYNNGYKTFISGGAIGVDIWAAQLIIKLRDRFTDMRLVIARPFPSQDSKWSVNQRAIYHHMLKHADLVIDVSDDPYAAYKMQIRNKWMVDHSKGVIAVWNGQSGGTKNCIIYALNQKLPVLRYNPINEYVEQMNNTIS